MTTHNSGYVDLKTMRANRPLLKELRDKEVIQQAIIQARQFPHQSPMHSNAMTVLFQAYRVEHLGDSFVSLDNLWSWLEQAHGA